MTIAREISVRGGILVAHDGSPASVAALRTAVRYAPAFGSRVEVVRVWNVASALIPPRVLHTHVPTLGALEASTLSGTRG